MVTGAHGRPTFHRVPELVVVESNTEQENVTNQGISISSLKIYIYTFLNTPKEFFSDLRYLLCLTI